MWRIEAAFLCQNDSVLQPRMEHFFLSDTISKSKVSDSLWL